MNPANVLSLFAQLRRRVRRLCLIVPAVLLLAGCGGGGGSVPTASTPVSTSVSTPISTPVSTPTPPSVIGQAVSKISLAVDKPTAQAGTSVRLTAVLTDATDKPLIRRDVIFSLDGTPINSAQANGIGQAVISYVLPLTQSVKPVTIKAIFAGDATFAACQASVPITVSAPATSLSLTLDKPIVAVGQSVTLTAPLTWAGGVLAGKPITFALGGTPIGTANTDATTGKATLTYTLAAGTPFGATTLTAAFAGDTGLAPSSASAPCTVQTPTSLTITPSSVTVTRSTTLFTMKAVLLDVKGNPLANKKAWFKYEVLGNGVTVFGAANTDATGTANVAVMVWYPTDTGGINGSIPRPIPPPHGTYASHITFDGDTTYAATSATLTVIVP